MSDKTKARLVAENETLRRRIAALEGLEVDSKRAEDAVRESERRYRTLAESTTDAIYIVDRDGTLLYANRSAAAYIGVPQSALVGKKQQDLFPPDVANRHIERLRRAFATGESGEMDELLQFGSQEVWLNIRSIPLRDEQGRITSVMGICRNITDRKQTEEALRKSHDELEQRVKERTAELAIFRRFAEASGQGFGMADMDGLVTYMNPALCRLAGVAKPEEAIGKRLSAYYPEGYMLRRETEILPALLQDGHWEGELVVSPAGTTIHILQNSFLIKDENGKPSRLASVITDITERKRSEEALRESEDRLRMAIAATNDAIWDCNLLDGTVSWNDNYATSFGRPPESSDSWQWWIDHIHPEDRDRVASSLKEATKGSQRFWTAEYRFLRADGVWADIFDRAYIAHDESGKAWRVVGAMLDITKRKAAEEALRASEERFRGYFMQGLLGMSMTGLDGRWLEVNDRLCEMFGYSRQELLGMAWTELTHPDDLDESLALYNRLLAGEIDHYTQNKRYVRKDGETVYATVFIRCVRRGDGTADQILGLIEDITERKRAEEALDRERQSLWLVLQASDHERQIISYEIHDGLAQYLSAAWMQFQAHAALKDDLPDEAAKAHDTAVELVRQAHSEARRLISEVRPPVIDEIGLETAISHLVQEQRRRGGPKIKFDSDVQFGRLPSILENSLYRIAQEAVTNACKHSKSKNVTVTLAQEGQEVRLEVRDWGIGFDPESVQKGHFGLDGVRQRVRLLGGRLTIDSTPGSGTLVQVVVPILEKHIGD